jgi:NAD(P)-dependent dehydrogenase (short-subunit alcohol dehydrogenase family)
MQLEGKVAIISGGGSGIGRGIALALAREGTRVVIFGRREALLDETLEIARSQGGEGLAVQADINRCEDVALVVDQTMAQYGQIDILVNNAGVDGGAPVHEIRVDDWERVMATNVRGPFLMARAILPHMRAQRSGHIINISSESGLEYYEGDGAYGTSKHALNALGEYIQRENQELNIRVNTICPGMVVSEMTENSPGLDPAKCLLPEDIADLVIWLLTRRENIKIGRPILIQTMLNPWE